MRQLEFRIVGVFTDGARTGNQLAGARVGGDEAMAARGVLEVPS